MFEMQSTVCFFSFRFLAPLTSLRHLNISKTGVTDNGFRYLADLPLEKVCDHYFFGGFHICLLVSLLFNPFSNAWVYSCVLTDTSQRVSIRRLLPARSLHRDWA